MNDHATMPDDDLVHLVYEAAGASELWPEVLAVLRRQLRGAAGVLYDVVDPSQARQLIGDNVQGYSDAATDAFYAHYRSLDVRAALLRPDAGPATVFADDRDVAFAELERSEIQAEFYRPNGVGHIAATVLARSPSRSSVLSIHRDRAAGAFAAEELALLDRLAPHLARAWALGARLREHADTASDLMRSLERQGGTLFVVRPDATLCAMTASAEAVLRRGIGLRARFRRLEATWPQDDAALKAILSAREPPAADSLLRLRLPPHASPMTLLFAPARPDPVAGSPRILVFLNRPHDARRPDPILLAQQFSLSRAEARVVAALAGGLNTEEAAARFGVTRETVRSQLKSAMAKCGTRTQAELVGLIHRSFAVFEP